MSRSKDQIIQSLRWEVKDKVSTIHLLLDIKERSLLLPEDISVDFFETFVSDYLSKYQATDYERECLLKFKAIINLNK